MNRAMALFDSGLIVANAKYDPSITDTSDSRHAPFIGPGLEWIESIHLALTQWHWDLCTDGTALVFFIVKPDVPHFRQKWENDAPAGALLLPSLLDQKTTVPAKVHGHSELKKMGVLPTHTTFDVMRIVWTHDAQRYYLSRPDYF